MDITSNAFLRIALFICYDPVRLYEKVYNKYIIHKCAHVVAIDNSVNVSFSCTCLLYVYNPYDVDIR